MHHVCEAYQEVHGTYVAQYSYVAWTLPYTASIVNYHPKSLDLHESVIFELKSVLVAILVGLQEEDSGDQVLDVIELPSPASSSS